MALALLVCTRPAAAERCPVPAGAAEALAEQSATQRWHQIERAVTAEARSARHWLLGWGIAHGALLGGSLALIPLDDRSARPDHVVGAAASAVGLVATQLGRHGALAATRELEGLPADGCAAVASAEATLARLADDDRLSTAWFVHVANVGFNVGMGLILGLGYDRWGPAALQMAGGSAIGELLIDTRPTAEDALARYRAGELDQAPKARLVPLLFATPTGWMLGARASF